VVFVLSAEAVYIVIAAAGVLCYFGSFYEEHAIRVALFYAQIPAAQAAARAFSAPGGAGPAGVRCPVPPREEPPAETLENLDVRVDRILGKISKRGLESLSAEERNLLEQASRKNRGREPGSSS
jgi:hypothetical protein